MRWNTVVRSVIAAGLACCTASCEQLLDPPHDYHGPGCLVNIYQSPNLKGAALPIRNDTEQLAQPWAKQAASAKVVYGTWRFYAEPEFVGFMGDYKAPADVPALAPEHHLGSLKCIEAAPDTSS
jgi:Beta/Gamma crystallin